MEKPLMSEEEFAEALETLITLGLVEAVGTPEDPGNIRLYITEAGKEELAVGQ